MTDFEKFLIERFKDETDNRFYNLNEWKGYNLDFRWMVDTLYKMFTDKRVKWLSMDNQKTTYIQNFMFKQVCFLGRFDITVTLKMHRPKNKIGKSYVVFKGAQLAVYNDKNGEFTPYNPEEVNFYNPDDIVYNGVKFFIEIESVNDKLPEYEFIAACWHEFMHAYQLYSEYLKNRNKLPNSLETNDIVYGNLMDRIRLYDSMGYTGMSKVARVLYKLRKDEINANLSMIYPFIKKTPSINFSNIMDYLPYLEIYKTVKLAEEVKDIVEKNLDNKTYKRNLDHELCQMFSNRYKEKDCTKLFLKYLIRMIPYLQDKMYRNAKSALEDLERMSVMNELGYQISGFLFND